MTSYAKPVTIPSVASLRRSRNKPESENADGN